eukprot:436344-Prorocentrum_minimum.AAC.1
MGFVLEECGKLGGEGGGEAVLKPWEPEDPKGVTFGPRGGLRRAVRRDLVASRYSRQPNETDERRKRPKVAARKVAALLPGSCDARWCRQVAEEERQLAAQLAALEAERAATRARAAALAGEEAKLSQLEERYWHQFNEFQLQLTAHMEDRDSVRFVSLDPLQPPSNPPRAGFKLASR